MYSSNQNYSNLDTRSFTNLDTRSYSNLDTRSYTTITDNNGTRKIVTKNSKSSQDNNNSLYIGLSIFALVTIITLVLYFNQVSE
jgi:uncharacterized membrane protein